MFPLSVPPPGWAREFSCPYMVKLGFLGGSAAKNPPVNPGDVDLISGSGRSPEERNGNSFQYSWLGNPMDKAAWWATIQMVARIRHDFASKQQQQHCQARSTNCFLHLQEHILGILNWAHWAGCVCHATIVLLFWGMFCCLVLLLSKPAWFCG